MIRLIIVALQVRFTMTANRLIHFLGLYSTYESVALKRVVVVLGVIFSFNKKTLFHLIYMISLAALGFGIAHFTGGADVVSTTENAFVIWFFISVIGAPLLSVTASGLNLTNDSMMVNYLRVNPATYAKSRILADVASGFLLYIPAFAVVFAILTESTVTWMMATIAALVLFVTAKITGEAINMWMFERFHITFVRMSASATAMVPIYGAGIIVPIFWDTPNISAVLSRPHTIILPGLIGAAALVYIKKYALFAQLFRSKITYLEAFNAKITAWSEEQSTSVAGNVNVKNWSKGIATENLAHDKFSHKEGFSYLNAIFFDRHRRFFAKKMIIRCLILILPLIATAVLPLLMMLNVVALDLPAVPLSRLFDAFSSVILLVVYTLSMGRVVTASVFSNCDVQMLHYPYYRRKNTILASFKARFAVILRYNFIIASVMFVSIIGSAALLFGYMKLHYAVLLFVAVFCTGLFFSFNDLFLYYVIQPYDSEGKARSFLNKIINWVISLISWISIWSAQFSLTTYAIVIAIATALYLGMGMIILLKFAPQRFKLR